MSVKTVFEGTLEVVSGWLVRVEGANVPDICVRAGSDPDAWADGLKAKNGHLSLDALVGMARAFPPWGDAGPVSGGTPDRHGTREQRRGERDDGAWSHQYTD